jgi:hypothetical protein
MIQSYASFTQFTATGERTYGELFNLSSEITISALSISTIFIPTPTPGFPTRLVGLWNPAGTLIVSANVDVSVPPVNNFWTKSITPITLPPGTDYGIGILTAPPDDVINSPYNGITYIPAVNNVRGTLYSNGTFGKPTTPAGSFFLGASFLQCKKINTITNFAPTLQIFTVANQGPIQPAGTIAYFSNGAGGAPMLAFSDGTNWLRADTGTIVS